MPSDNSQQFPPNAQHSDGQSPWEDEAIPEPSTADSADLHIRSSSPSDVEHGRLPIPVWMRESSKSFHWRWVPLPIRTFTRSATSWSKGPDPPQIQKVTPFLPFIQETPLKLLDRFLPKRKHKAALFALFYLAWILTFSLVLRHSAKSGTIEGYGKPQPLWCGANYWYDIP